VKFGDLIWGGDDGPYRSERSNGIADITFTLATNVVVRCIASQFAMPVSFWLAWSGSRAFTLQDRKRLSSPTPSAFQFRDPDVDRMTVGMGKPVAARRLRNYLR
jgi:hypothetical protein